MRKRLLSWILTIVLLVSALPACLAEAVSAPSVLTEVFVRQELFRQFCLIYDTFNAAITLEDGTEIPGIGYTDYAAYYEAEDGSVGYFPAGFIADYGFAVPEDRVVEGLIIENLDFDDEAHQFIYDYGTTPFMEHCVKDGQYLKYGVNDQGAITYEARAYQRGVCDESLGALFSYDTNRFVFDPEVGNYARINGVTLFEQIDFAAMEAMINQIIEEQNANFSRQEIITDVHIAQDAIVSHLRSLQEETFLGYSVSELVQAASQLDPMQCIRITPEGFVIIDVINQTPVTASDLTKWLVGAGCLILVAGSVALQVFIPATRRFDRVIRRKAFDVFMQVVVENKSLEDVEWGKIAVAVVTTTMLAWVCPLAGSQVADVAVKASGSKVWGELAGYGVKTFSTSMVVGTSKLVYSMMEGKDDGWNAFWTGAAISAAATIVASALSEALYVLGPKVTELLSQTKSGQWLNKTIGEAGSLFNKPVKYNNKWEEILDPKSVHQAAESAWMEINNQSGMLGGSYASLINPGDGTMEKHEIPSYSAYNQANGIENGKRGVLPAIQMDAADHRRTASWGYSDVAQQYQEKECELWSTGKTHDAIQMGIDDIRKNFGAKYNEQIKQMLEYATEMGWW